MFKLTKLWRNYQEVAELRKRQSPTALLQEVVRALQTNSFAHARKIMEENGEVDFVLEGPPGEDHDGQPMLVLEKPLTCAEVGKLVAIVAAAREAVLSAKISVGNDIRDFHLYKVTSVVGAHPAVLRRLESVGVDVEAGPLLFADLNFKSCKTLTDAAVEALAGGLGQASSVSLKFRGCEKLTDAAVQALAGGLGQASSVSLDFGGCEELTEDGEALVRELNRSAEDQRGETPEHVVSTSTADPGDETVSFEGTDGEELPDALGHAEFVRELLLEVLFSEFVDIGSDVTNAIVIACDSDLAAYVLPAVGVALLSGMSFLISAVRQWWLLREQEALLAEEWAAKEEEVVGDSPEVRCFFFFPDPVAVQKYKVRTKRRGPSAM